MNNNTTNSSFPEVYIDNIGIHYTIPFSKIDSQVKEFIYDESQPNKMKLVERNELDHVHYTRKWKEPVNQEDAFNYVMSQVIEPFKNKYLIHRGGFDNENPVWNDRLYITDYLHCRINNIFAETFKTDKFSNDYGRCKVPIIEGVYDMTN